MAGKSSVTADEEQRRELVALSPSRDRGEADRARAIVLTLSGWTSGQIAEAFGVREDTVRVWRSTFICGRGRDPTLSGPVVLAGQRDVLPTQGRDMGKQV